MSIIVGDGNSGFSGKFIYVIIIICDNILQAFLPPPDPQLMKYIEEANEKIMPLATSKEQVIALAKQVIFFSVSYYNQYNFVLCLED